MCASGLHTPPNGAQINTLGTHPIQYVQARQGVSSIDDLNKDLVEDAVEEAVGQSHSHEDEAAWVMHDMPMTLTASVYFLTSFDQSW